MEHSNGFAMQRAISWIVMVIVWRRDVGGAMNGLS
jgi:hypothetical protein